MRESEDLLWPGAKCNVKLKARCAGTQNQAHFGAVRPQVYTVKPIGREKLT